MIVVVDASPTSNQAPIANAGGVIEETGLHFMRFHDEEIRKDMPQVLEQIREHIKRFTR